MLFKLEDSPLFEFVQIPATFDLPAATLGSYKQWLETVRPVDGEKLDDTLRMYRAALAVGQLEAEGLILSPTNDELNMTLVKWVNDCIEQTFGPHLVVEAAAVTLGRRQLSPLTKPVFEPADFASILPGLAHYTGQIEFPALLTQKHYRECHKALQPLPKVDPRHPDNSLLARQFRAGVALMKQWAITTAAGEEVSWATVSREDGRSLPLELASFVVEAVDTYLFKRLNLKKSLWMSTPTA
jgi:hypothetical protein